MDSSEECVEQTTTRLKDIAILHHKRGIYDCWKFLLNSQTLSGSKYRQLGGGYTSLNSASLPVTSPALFPIAASFAWYMVISSCCATALLRSLLLMRATAASEAFIFASSVVLLLFKVSRVHSVMGTDILTWIKRISKCRSFY
jgi:hypothetical protein